MSAIALGSGVYSSRLAAKLAGVSLRRLRYWTTKGLIGPSSYDAPGRGRDLFSYVDIVQARVIARLRTDHLSLQRITKAIIWLKDAMAGDANWQTKTLVTDGRDLFVMLGPGEAETYSTVVAPGQSVVKVSLIEIAQELERAGELLSLNDRLTTDPAVLGGAPVIRDTRVPTNLIYRLRGEGMTPAQIKSLYPGIDEGGIAAAEEFERQLAAV